MFDMFVPSRPFEPLKWSGKFGISISSFVYPSRDVSPDSYNLPVKSEARC